MNRVIAFYSRTGTNRKIAQELSKQIQADIFEIKEDKDRSGVKGFVVGGFDAVRKKKTNIKDQDFDVDKYDCLIMVSPIWVGNLPPAARVFLDKYKKNFEKFFVLSVSRQGDLNKTFIPAVEQILGCKLDQSLLLKEQDLESDDYQKKLRNFV